MDRVYFIQSIAEPFTITFSPTANSNWTPLISVSISAIMSVLTHGTVFQQWIPYSITQKLETLL